jgi:hypothetical protein
MEQSREACIEQGTEDIIFFIRTGDGSANFPHRLIILVEPLWSSHLDILSRAIISLLSRL